MSDINLNLILAIFIGFGSTLIQSLTGFGLSIVSTPLFLMVYDPKQVVLILQVICVVIKKVDFILSDSSAFRRASINSCSASFTCWIFRHRPLKMFSSIL